MTPPCTVVELFEASTAQIIDDSGRARTTRQILEAGTVLSARLSAAGVRPGDRVAVQMTNVPEYLDLLAAAAVGRFVIMSVNTRFAGPLAASLIERSGAGVLVRSPSDLAALPPADPPGPDHAPTPDDRYVIFTTSGTTSAPKLVVHAQRSIAHHAAETAVAFGWTPESTVLIPLPLCGTFALATLMGAIAGDATIVVPERFDTDQTAALIEQHGVTTMHGPDDMFHRLLATDADLSSIDTAGYGRFNSSLDGIVDRAAERGVPLSGVYGMSEVQALFARRPSSAPPEQRWVAGGDLVSLDAEYRVVDGELQLKGPSLFEGYLADGGAHLDAELAATNFDDGWFCTGDLAEVEGPRSFRFVTRLGDTMRLGGFLVAPVEIETALLERPEVAAAQVVAVDLPNGARPVAFVLLAEGEALDEQGAIVHCQNSLALFKAPVRIVAVDAFPVTDGPNGVKIQRSVLRSQAAELLSDGA